MKLYNQLKEIIKLDICDSKETYAEYIKRLEKGKLTRDENQRTHFCTYFLPYNEKSHKIFIVHHKKANLWISPGGHIDKGEELKETLNREISEELGVKNFFETTPKPFLLTITPIENEIQPCKKHFDVWYLAKTNGADFNIDSTEFYDTKWATLKEAKKMITNIPNKKALKALKKLYA